MLAVKQHTFTDDQENMMSETSEAESKSENKPEGQTPYSAWMQTDTLHSLQRTVSDHPGEHAWIVHVQVSELYWMLIIKEIQSAQGFLRADDLPQAWRTLQRVVAHHAPLDAIWRSI